MMKQLLLVTSLLAGTIYASEVQDSENNILPITKEAPVSRELALQVKVSIVEGETATDDMMYVKNGDFLTYAINELTVHVIHFEISSDAVSIFFKTYTKNEQGELVEAAQAINSTVAFGESASFAITGTEKALVITPMAIGEVEASAQATA